MYASTNRLATGRARLRAAEWHHLALRFLGSTIEAAVDGERVVSLVDSAFVCGMAGLGSDWRVTHFDDFRVGPAPAWAS